MKDSREIIERLFSGSEPELGPGPRAGVASPGQIDKAVKEALAGCKLDRDQIELTRAMVLLWHDHLDAAHVIAQDIDNRDGSFVHAIMHRREPDYSNAKYWFRRVGDHPCFPKIATSVSAALEAVEERTLLRQLVPDGNWDPFAFVDVCEEVASKEESKHQLDRLWWIQRAEMMEFLKYLLDE